MSHNNSIDKLFKEGLQNYSAQPSDELWLKVENKLRLKKMFKYSFYASAALIIVLLLIFTSLHFTDKKVKEQTLANTHNSTTADEKADIALNENLVVDTDKDTNKDKKINSDKQKPSISENIDNKSPHKTANNQQSSRKPLNNEVVVIDVPLQITTLESTNAENVTNKHSIKVIGSMLPDTKKDIEGAITMQTSENEIQVVFETDNNDRILSLIAPDISLENDSTQLTQVPPIQVGKKTVIKPFFEAMLYVMPSYAAKTVSGVSSDFVDFKKAHETNQIFINYGIDCRMRFNNFFVLSGIMQTQSGEKNNYFDKYLNQIDTTGSHYAIHTVSNPDPNNPGNTIITFDSSWVHKSDSIFAEVNLRNINTLRYIEIPLNLGYVLHAGHHQFTIQGGMSCAFLSQAKVSLVDKETLNVVNYTQADNVFNKTLWSYNVNLGYAYNLSGNTGFFVQAGYRKNINGAFKAIPLQQHYYFIDTKVGIIFKF